LYHPKTPKIPRRINTIGGGILLDLWFIILDC
jgi:hypothetical protein